MPGRNRQGTPYEGDERTDRRSEYGRRSDDIQADTLKATINETNANVKELTKEFHDYRRENDQRHAEYERENDRRHSEHDRELEINRGALKRAFEKAEEKQSIAKQYAPLAVIVTVFIFTMNYFSSRMQADLDGFKSNTTEEIIDMKADLRGLGKAVADKNANIVKQSQQIQQIADILPKIDERQRKLVTDLEVIKGEVRAQGAILQTLDKEGSRALLREIPK